MKKRSHPDAGQTLEEMAAENGMVAELQALRDERPNFTPDAPSLKPTEIENEMLRWCSQDAGGVGFASVVSAKNPAGRVVAVV